MDRLIPVDDFLALPVFLQQACNSLQPWEITGRLQQLIMDALPLLHTEYTITGGVAIHKSATIETGVVLKAPVIIGPGCFVGAHAYLRGGVWLGEQVSIGTGCEIKTSIVCSNSAMAHFNFIGDSIIGSYVNFEAGAVIANHFNERTDKEITVLYDGCAIHTGVKKFGALVGDHCKTGANAVLSPGTILPKHTIIKRLELVAQLPE